MSWFAVTSDGAARRVGTLGLVIGRAPTCDVVLGEPEVSRRHVLLQFDMRGQLDIVPMPRARTLVNGVAIDAPVTARDGDVLAFPGGATIRLTVEGQARDRTNALAWLFDVGGRRIGLRRETLEIGGGEDDIMIETWPANAARLSWRGAEPWFEPHVDGIARNDAPLARGTAVALAAGDRLTCGQRTIRLATESTDPMPTAREAARVTAITLEMLPTGGMVTITTTRGEHCALLAERRFALMMVLLQPPGAYKAGEYIPDEVVFAAVWPRSDSVDRVDLNQLVTRLRADLKAAGLPGSQLVDRYAKGGATRFVVEGDVAITART